MDYLSNGKILVVDLGVGAVEDLDLEDKTLLETFGGLGLNNYLLKKYEGKEPVVLGTGMLTGSICPGSGGGIISALHPVFKRPCHIPLNLTLAAEMKYSGYDHIVLLGTAKAPSYLWVHDGVADIQSADGIWGADTWATTDHLRRELGDPLIQTIVIGKAGEIESPYGCVCFNYWDGNDAFGIGAVLGGKKLKALAFRGMGLFEIKEPEGFVGLSSEILKEWKTRHGTMPQGINGIYRLMGRKDLDEWLSPIVHSHRASFNTPFAGCTFVFIDESPGLRRESPLESPGMLLTGFLAPMLLYEKGLGPKEAGSFIRNAAKAGIDPVSFVRGGNIDPLTFNDWADLSSKPLAQRVFEDIVLSPYIPRLPNKEGLEPESDEYLSWWKKRVALGFTFGLDPLFLLIADFVDEQRLLELVKLGTGLDLDAQTFDKALEDMMV